MFNSCGGISRLSLSVISWHRYHFCLCLFNDDTQALQPARLKYLCLITTVRNKNKQIKDSYRNLEQLQAILPGINDISGDSTCSSFYFWCNRYTLCPEPVLAKGGAISPCFPQGHHFITIQKTIFLVSGLRPL